jgi:hypothetical protein
MFVQTNTIAACLEYIKKNGKPIQRFRTTYIDLPLSKFHKSNFYRDALKMRVQTKNVLNESLAKNPVVLNEARE